MSFTNALIHLRTLFRPSTLRPDLRVASTANVDWAGLRRAGFNAVVVDKDNCLTLPKSDELWPAHRESWAEVLRVFGARRVLVVSNSSGTSKDPGGVGAEMLSRNLGAPVLLHRTPKPGCDSSILAYFRGDLGRPKSTVPTVEVKRAAVEEDEDERALLARWRQEVDGPLCGPLDKSVRLELGLTADGGGGGSGRGGKEVEERMVNAENDPEWRTGNEKSTSSKEDKKKDTATEPTRIIVVGDRLFTDVTLARRLASRLRSSLPTPSSSSSSSSFSLSHSSSLPSTLAVQTTLLPQPKDVRVLRYLETLLSGGRLASSSIDWGRYTLTPPSPPLIPSSLPSSSLPWPISYAQPLVDRYNSLVETLRARVAALHPSVWAVDNGPAMTWHPRTWRAWPVFLYLFYGMGTVGRLVARGVKVGAAWAMPRVREGGVWVWAQGKEAWKRSREVARERRVEKEVEKSVVAPVAEKAAA